MPSQTDDGEVAETNEADRPAVTAHESVADRTVFTEDGNKEGWIATDLTVELSR